MLPPPNIAEAGAEIIQLFQCSGWFTAYLNYLRLGYLSLGYLTLHFANFRVGHISAGQAKQIPTIEILLQCSVSQAPGA